MRILGKVIGWLTAAIFTIIAAALFGMGGPWQGALVLGIAVLFAPPTAKLFARLTGKSLPWWGRVLGAVALWVAMVFSIVINPAESIYKSDEYRRRFMEMYDAQLAKWPVPYESRFVETTHGKIFAIVSGPVDAPALMLFHASGVGAWSWLPNIKVLSEHYRVYAFDNIGEVGKNEMKSRDSIPRSGAEVGALCATLARKLGVTHAYVAGASIGGYIATNFALYFPNMVDKVVLLGPMGYGSTGKTVALMTLAQAFPFDFVQDWALRWAFGESTEVRRMFDEWFKLLMRGAMPNPIPPHTFTPQLLGQIEVPVLAFFGTRDEVIGSASAAASLAGNIPQVKVETIASGHLIAAEHPDRVNAAMLEFFAEPVSAATSGTVTLPR